jgi:hypothetical protein
MAFQPLPYWGFRAIYLIEHRGFSLMEFFICGVPHVSSLGPLLFSMFTTDLPLALNKACVCLFVDGTTLYASATTASEIIAK